MVRNDIFSLLFTDTLFCSCCSNPGLCLFPGACLACNRGFYQPQSGQQQCWPCDRGYYSKWVYTRCKQGKVIMVLTHCPTYGVFVLFLILYSTTGSPLCSACPPGSFNNNTGGVDCTSCSPGVFRCWLSQNSSWLFKAIQKCQSGCIFVIKMNQNWVPLFSAAYRILCFTPEFHFLFTVYARYFLQVGSTELVMDFSLSVLSIVVVALDVGVSAELWWTPPSLTSHAFIPCLPLPAQLHRHTRPSSAAPDLISKWKGVKGYRNTLECHGNVIEDDVHINFQNVSTPIVIL